MRAYAVYRRRPDGTIIRMLYRARGEEKVREWIAQDEKANWPAPIIAVEDVTETELGQGMTFLSKIQGG